MEKITNRQATKNAVQTDGSKAVRRGVYGTGKKCQRTLVSRCVQACQPLRPGKKKKAASPRGRPGSGLKPKKKKHRFLFPGRGGLKRSR